MKKMLLAMIVGYALGSLTVPVLRAAGVHGDGYLMGWTVTMNTNSGDTIECSDPYVWAGIRELDCDAD